MSGGILILGAGGHAKVVADILRCGGQHVRGFLDDDPARWGQTLFGLPVLNGIDHFAAYNPSGLIAAIGSNRARAAIVRRLGARAEPLWVNGIHPTATVASSVRLGRGVMLAAGVIVNPDTVIGDHTILNTASSVDHDCQIAAYVHLAPGVRLAGNVAVGEGAFVGIGAAVIPGQAIGAWATVGAGAAVVTNIPAHMTAMGVPARWPRSDPQP